MACRIWWKSFQPKGTKSIKSPEAEPAVEENDHGNELSSEQKGVRIDLVR